MYHDGFNDEDPNALQPSFWQRHGLLFVFGGFLAGVFVLGSYFAVT
jgi:hypothetical protein